MYFWDVELDTVQYFNFENGRGEQDDYPSGADGQDEDKDTNDAERCVSESLFCVNFALCVVLWCVCVCVCVCV